MDPKPFWRPVRFVEVLVVIFVLLAMAALFLPAIGAAREEEYRRACQERIKQIAVAMNDYEYSFNAFPLISSRDGPQLSAALRAKPASAIPGKTEAGWSWIVRILPYLEESKLHENIVVESSNFSIDTGPFTPAIHDGDLKTKHCSCVVLPKLICPSWGGNANTACTAQIDTVGATSGAPEYANVDSDIHSSGDDDHSSYKGRVAPTNYKPIVGTHLVAGAPLENGAMLLTAEKGSTISSICDGTSRTFLLAETKEWGYASWYDGTLNWLVINDPNAPTAPATISRADNTGTRTNGKVAINVGPQPGSEIPIYYLPKELTSNSPRNSVNWGPSSDHSNGMVMHAFADTHVQGITVLCDPAVYLTLTTRCGVEDIRPELIGSRSARKRAE